MAKKISRPVEEKQKIQEEVQCQVVDCQEKIDDLTNRWKRALADYQNLEKRYGREKQDFVQFANANLILKLLTIFDHLQRAQDHLKDEGLKLAIKEMKRVLEEEGLEEIQTIDKEFNPEEMEALEVVKDDKDGRVVEEINKGYKLKGKVIRVAKVKVGERS